MTWRHDNAIASVVYTEVTATYFLITLNINCCL